MEKKQEQSGCKHYLSLEWRQGKPSSTIWAKCQNCARAWFLGRNGVVVAGPEGAR